jgi:hypothetical protein
MVQGVFTKLAAKSRPQKTLFCTFPSTRRRHTATNSAVSARLHKLIISSSGNSAATRASQDKSNLRSACRASGWLMSGLVRLGAYSGRSRRAQHADGMTHKSRNFGCAVIDRQRNVHVHVPCCPSTRLAGRHTPPQKKTAGLAARAAGLEFDLQPKPTNKKYSQSLTLLAAQKQPRHTRISHARVCTHLLQHQRSSLPTMAGSVSEASLLRAQRIAH